MTFHSTPPADRITPGVPPSHPNWWGHHRRPQTDREVLELAAARWTPDADLERVRLVRDRHAAIFQAAATNVVSALDEYEKRRAAAVEMGRTVPEPAEELIAEIDAAAVVFGESERAPDFATIDRQHRDTFRKLIATLPDLPAVLKAWAAWTAALDAERAYAARRAGARSVLGVRGGGMSDPYIAHDYNEEFNAAVGRLR